MKHFKCLNLAKKQDGGHPARCVRLFHIFMNETTPLRPVIIISKKNA